MTIILPFTRACSRQSISKAAAIFRASNGVSRVAISNSNSHFAAQPPIWPPQDSLATLLTRFYATEATETPSRPKAHTGRAKATKPRTSTAKASSSTSKSRKTAAKKPKSKKKPARKPARKPKRKTKAKAKSKPKPKRKPTEKSKAVAARKKAAASQKQLAVDALISSEPKGKPSTAFSVIFAETAKASARPGTSATATATTSAKEASAKYKALTPEEREHYNQLATQNRAEVNAARQKWIQSLSPEQVLAANKARIRLRHLKKTKKGKKASTPRAIGDDRLVKNVRRAFTLFSKDRWASGDFAGMQLQEAAKLIADEFKRLSDGQKKIYKDRELADVNRYRTEYKTVYNRDPPQASQTTKKKIPAAAAATAA